jgi:hypothetical protein
MLQPLAISNPAASVCSEHRGRSVWMEVLCVAVTWKATSSFLQQCSIVPLAWARRYYLESQLFRMRVKLRNPAVVLPKLNVVTIDHLPGTFLCTVVVVADQIDGFHEMTVPANKVCSIVRHSRHSLTSATWVRRRASHGHRRSWGQWGPGPDGCGRIWCTAESSARIRIELR